MGRERKGSDGKNRQESPTADLELLCRKQTYMSFGSIDQKKEYKWTKKQNYDIFVLAIKGSKKYNISDIHL